MSNPTLHGAKKEDFHKFRNCISQADKEDCHKMCNKCIHQADKRNVPKSVSSSSIRKPQVQAM